MLQDKDTAKIGFDIPTKYIVLLVAFLALLTLGLFGLTALGSASLMF